MGEDLREEAAQLLVRHAFSALISDLGKNSRSTITLVLESQV